MSKTPLADPGRDLIVNVLLSDPAIKAAEDYRQDIDSAGNTYSETDGSQDLIVATSDTGRDEEVDVFLGLIGDGGNKSKQPSPEDTDQIPAITDQMIADFETAKGASAESADADEDETESEEEGTAANPDKEKAAATPGRISSSLSRINTRSPKTWLAAAAAIILIALAVSSLGRSEPNEPALLSPAGSSSGESDSSEQSPGNRDAPIAVASATSRCPAGSTDPMLAFDELPDSAWVCVRAWGIDGQILQIDLGGVYAISQIGLVPGWNTTNADGSDEWARHRVVSRVTYEFNDVAHSKWTQETRSARELVMSDVSGANGAPVIASHVTITIEETSSTSGQQRSGGSESASDFAVSEIRVLGRVPEK